MSSHLYLSPQGSATSSTCDDTPKWRETLVAREVEETVPNETATGMFISKKLFLSPAKTIFKLKMKSGVSRRLEQVPASANEQADTFA